MEKDFDLWNNQKKSADNNHLRPMFKEREIWWCSVGLNIGDEQNGKGRKFLRPVFVYKKFNKNIFLGVPLSTKIKDNKFYFQFEFKGEIRCMVLSQIRLFDAKRFSDKMGEIPSAEYLKIREKLQKLVF